MLILLIGLQTAAASPDIQLHARATARNVVVEQRGTARLTVRAEPEGGSTVQVDAPAAERTLRNVTVTVDATARISTDTSVASPKGD
jgi:hypothetical protein